MSTPVEQATVERVAEAIWRASCKRNPAKPPWPSVNFATQDHCRELAEAAIEALQLTEERRVARSICDMADPGIPESRLVGPWRTAGEAL